MSDTETSLSANAIGAVTVMPGEYTAAALFAMPRDGRRRELIRGALYTMTPAGFEHGRIAAALQWRLAAFISQNNLGVTLTAETGFLLSTNPDTVRAPDIAFVRRERLKAVKEQRGYFSGAPDLAVEIVSPYDSYSRVVAMARMWLDYGCQQVWIVEPESQQIAVHRIDGTTEVFRADQTLLAADLFPDWQLAVADIFVSA